MEWEKPEFVEISLPCEVGSYANAELPDSPALPEGKRADE
jgi:coenzyme PQQ precursor peptide PqqA